MKKKTLLLLPFLLLASCSNNITTIISNPYLDGGLGGNEKDDQVPAKDTQDLIEFMQRVGKQQTYSYEVTSNVTGNPGHFVDYFTPHAWFEKNLNDFSKSVGYAETLSDKTMFRYYLNEAMDTVYPSVYEYTGYDTLEKIKGIYGAMTLSNFTMLDEFEEEITGANIGGNRFLITDPDCMSIFQYMTTFGSSITDYIVGVYVEIVDFDSLQFKASVDLGNYGTIDSVYTPLETSPIDFVSAKLADGTLKGVDSYPDVEKFFTETAMDSYVLNGIKSVSSTGSVTESAYTIHCTNDYFYFHFNDQGQYRDFGFVLVPANQEVTYRSLNSNGETVEVKQKLAYDACYEFSKDANGYYYSGFEGPVEGNLRYVEVDALPEVGEADTLYIVTENGTKYAYEYVEGTGGAMEFKRYSKWFSSVGDFYINNLSATFYLSSTPLVHYGPLYYEQTIGDEDSYYTKDSDIMTALANGLFGWGFQPTTTWMSYVERSTLKFHREGGLITSADIGLDIEMPNQQGTNNIYYTMSDFGNGAVDEIDAFLGLKK